jgi:hypothetical protein
VYRLVGMFLILAGSVYGNGSCNCPPSIIVFINGVSYSSSFTPVSVDEGNSYQIQGSVTNSTFQFTLNVTTHPDPDIDFDTSILGDPTVAIVITQTFLAGPALQLITTSSGVIQDLNGDKQASALGSPFIQTTLVDGNTENQLNTGCNITSSTAFFTAPCPSVVQMTQLLQLPNPNPNLPPHGVLEMDIGFTLSEGDKYTLDGSSTLSAIPEPPATIPLAAGLLVMAGIAWRRNRNRVRTRQGVS